MQPGTWLHDGAPRWAVGLAVGDEHVLGVVVLLGPGGGGIVAAENTRDHGDLDVLVNGHRRLLCWHS